jgi:hypothetical protein
MPLLVAAGKLYHVLRGMGKDIFYLRDVEEQGVSFYSLSAKQTINEGLAAVA